MRHEAFRGARNRQLRFGDHRLQNRRLAVPPEHVGQCIHRLSDGRVRPHTLQQGGHQIDGRVRGIGPHPRERAIDGIRIAIELHRGEPLQLIFLTLAADFEDVRRGFVVA